MGLPAVTSGAAPFPGQTALKTRYYLLLRRWRRSRVKRREIGRITRELNAYTHRELGELGLDRADIPAIARGTYQRG